MPFRGVPRPQGPYPPRWIPLRDPARRGPQPPEGTNPPQALKPPASPFPLPPVPPRDRRKGLRPIPPGGSALCAPPQGEPACTSRDLQAYARPGDPSGHRPGSAGYSCIARSDALPART